MKKTDIKVLGTYRAKVAGKQTVVRVDSVRDEGGYDVMNLATGRRTVFRTPQRFIEPADPVGEGIEEVEQGSDPTQVVTLPAAGTEEAIEPDEAEELVRTETVADRLRLEERAVAPEAEHCSDPTTPALTAEQISTTAVTATKTSLGSPSGARETNNVSAIGAKLREAAASLSPNESEPPHVQVRALAGTGKTTTAVEGMKVVKGLNPSITPSPQQAAVWEQMKLGKSDTIRFNAFGKAIASTLQAKLAEAGLDKRGCEASTFHSLGNRAVYKAFGRMEVSEHAVKDLAASLLGKDPRELQREPGGATLLKATDDLVSLCKQTLTEPTPDGLDQLTSHYDVELNGSKEKVYDLVPLVLERCKDPRGKITFDDMVWLPVVHGLPIQKVDVLIIDESQDLNRMQQALAKASGHRLIFIGDPHQAIFGFAGADAESMPRLERELAEGRGCVTLPLTVTRRCGKAIVEEARRYVPEYEAHPDNPEGVISEARYPIQGGKDERVVLPWEKTYGPQVRSGDFVLCRTNAPLVTECFRFLKRGLKANIQGRDVGRGLTAVIQKAEKAGHVTVPRLVGYLDDWLAAETAKEQAKRMPSETKLTALQDRHDCLVCFTDGAQTLSDVLAKIDSVFTDAKDSPGVKFSSIHRAKGLEADRVFFLRPSGAGPRTDKMKAWELVQETNLGYVAITRAIRELVYVD